MMREQGYLLLDALNASGERSIVIYNELQNQIVKRLIGQAYRVVDKDQFKNLSTLQLTQLTRDLHLYRIQIFDGSGTLRASSQVSHSLSGLSQSIAGLIQPLLQGIQDTLIIGMRQGDMDGEPRFAVGVQHSKDGAVVVSIKGQRLSAIRREMGPGRLIQEFGRQPGVAYVALQDTLSIILASHAISQLSRIETDDFLSDAWHSGSKGFRVVSFEDREVFETVGTFRISDELIGLFRVGLETSHYQEIRKSARLRLLMLGVLAVVIGVVSFAFLVAMQNIRLIDKAYNRFRSRSSEILQNLEDAVIAVNAYGAITVFNRAAERLLSLSQKDVIAQSIRNLGIDCLSILNETLESRQAKHCSEYTCRIGDDERILSLHTSILFSENEIETAILVITDLSEQKRLEFQVRQQEKFQAMGKLAAAVAHEIRNPINAIGMIAQRFRKEFRPQFDVEEYDGLVQSILDEVHRTNRIVQQFLQFARPKPLSFQSVSGKTFLQDVIQLFKSSTQIQHVEFESSNLDEAQIEIDPEQMKQALLNLLQNALEASGQSGRITLSGRSTNVEYVITIQDQGNGISEDERKRVFDLYFTTKPNGTGLGLPITFQIIQAHHGSIDLESTVGEGTVFRIHLPVRQDDLASA